MDILADRYGAAELLQGMVESAVNTSRATMERFGFLPFTAFGHRDNGALVPVVVDQITADNKPQIADAIRQIFAQASVIRYVLMVESWWAEGEVKDASGNIIPPSKRPDHKEVIMIMARDGKQVHHRIMQIDRDRAGKFSSLSLLEDFPPSSEQPSMVGIFADLLPTGALYGMEPQGRA